jgi:hypothetical protein
MNKTVTEPQQRSGHPPAAKRAGDLHRFRQIRAGMIFGLVVGFDNPHDRREPCLFHIQSGYLPDHHQPDNPSSLHTEALGAQRAHLLHHPGAGQGA